MSRISIDVTPDQHKRLKAMAALAGQSIKEFVLERTLAPSGPAAASQDPLRQLEALGPERPRPTQPEDSSAKRFDSILRDVYREPPT